LAIAPRIGYRSAMLVLGIDAGGSKTVACLGDEHANILSEARGPGANLARSDVANVEAVLEHLLRTALGGRSASLAAVCVGMAGLDRPDDGARVREMIGRLVDVPLVETVNDALIALEAGAPGAAGVVIISGTGSIAYGRDTRGHAARAGGWGSVLSDEGSAYWIGHQALRAVMRQADGRGPATDLTPRLLAAFGRARAEDLVRDVYAPDFEPSAMASLASVVEGAAEADDAVARAIVDAGARELSIAAISVANQLGLATCPVILAGGVFRAVPRMVEALIDQLRDRWDSDWVQLLGVEPAVGAVRLALRAAAGESIAPVYIGVGRSAAASSDPARDA
jgi:N-acetylglucosamine kinase-like BadF-type ATPase